MGSRYGQPGHFPRRSCNGSLLSPGSGGWPTRCCSTPGSANPDTDVVGDAGVVKVTVAGLVGAASHVPVPTAAIVAVEY